MPLSRYPGESPIPEEELRFYRLIEERSVGPDAGAAGYTLACGHLVVVSPAYPETINYLPCPLCMKAWKA